MFKLSIHTSIKEIERPKDKYKGYHCIDDYHPLNQLHEIDRLIEGFKDSDMEWKIWTWSTYIIEYIDLLKRTNKAIITLYIDDVESYEYNKIYEHLNKPFDVMDDLSIKIFNNKPTISGDTVVGFNGNINYSPSGGKTNLTVK